MYTRTYEKRYYATISANSSSYSDFDIASGEYFVATCLGGDAVGSNDVKAEIIIDPTGTPEVLLSVHGDTVQEMPARIIDGVEKIRLKLTNDSGQSETFGCFISGEYYGA